MIGVIAANTFLEAIRDRIWVIVIIFGFALLAGQHAFTPIALGEGPRVRGGSDPSQLPVRSSLPSDRPNPVTPLQHRLLCWRETKTEILT